VDDGLGNKATPATSRGHPIEHRQSLIRQHDVDAFAHRNLRLGILVLLASTHSVSISDERLEKTVVGGRRVARFGLNLKTSSVRGPSFPDEVAMNKPKRPWGLTFVAVLLVAFGPLALVAGLEQALQGRYTSAAGSMTQGAVILTTGILVLLHQKDAVPIARVCAILFTIGCLVHGLTILDIIQAFLVWAGYTWYKSWRIQTGP
jgi:hypothetical protein